jgi:hypothetical protein
MREEYLICCFSSPSHYGGGVGERSDKKRLISQPL